MMKILITGTGGPTPRSIARALRKYGGYKKPYHLIATDADPHAIGLYLPDLFDRSYLVPEAGHPDYWPVLNGIVADEQIDCAIISPELEVLEWARKSQEGLLPCKGILPDYQLARRLVDKSFLADALAPCGLAPKSFTISAAEADQWKEFLLPYPFWVRSPSGSSGLGALKIQSAEELKIWMCMNPDIEIFLASEYLPGRNLACKLLYHNGDLVRAAVAERVEYIMAKVAPSGVTGNTSFGRLINDPGVFQVARKALDIVMEKTQTARHGFFTVDLKEDSQGVPKVTEVNIRAVAFVGCFAAAGANFAEDMIRLSDGDPAFDYNFRLYEFEPGTIFMRDVDEQPVLLREDQMMKLFHREK